jgi:small-conductance mechanosensitive channel
MASLRTALWYLALLVSFVLLVVYWGAFISVESLRKTILPWLPKIAFSLMVLFAVHFLLEATQPVVRKVIGRHFHPWERDLLSHLYIGTVWALAVVVIVVGIFGSLSSLGISFGLIGAGLALALQQAILSFVGWFLIVIKRPYKVGDRIQIPEKGLQGDVENITALYTVLKEISVDESVTGRNIIIPNSTVFLEPIVNYSYDVPYVWVSIPISVTYESDLALAERIIFEVAKGVAGEDMRRAVFLIRNTTPSSVQADMAREEPIIRVEFADSSVTVIARIMCLPKQVRQFKTEIYRRIFETFRDPANKGKVEIAYPHMELVFHDEGMSDRVRRFFDGGRRRKPSRSTRSKE